MNETKGLPDLPEGWAWTELKDICSHITKGSTPTSYGFIYKTEGISFIKTENLDKDGKVISITDYIDEETNAFLKRSILQSNDLLFSIAGTIGRVGLVKDKDLPANTNQALAIVRLITKHLNARFVFYFLRSPAIQKRVLTSIVGVGRANVSLTNLGDFFVPLPPLPEQHRIIAKIEELFTKLDTGVDALKTAHAQLGRYRQSVLKAAVTGELTREWREAHKAELEPAADLLARILRERRAKWEADQFAKMQAAGKTPKNDDWKQKYQEPAVPDTSELPELPGGWTWTNIEQVGEVSGGLTKNQKREKLSYKMPYLRVANVYAGELDLAEIKIIGIEENELERVLLTTGDLLVVEGNGSIDQIGRVALWDGRIAPCLHQNHLIKVRFKPIQIGEYILWWLLSREGRDFITKAASSTSGLHTLSISKVAGLPIPLPSLSEQQEIVSEVERLLSIADATEQTIEQSLKQVERLRQSILQQAFTGKLVPQDPNDEPASRLLERIREERERKAEAIAPKQKRKSSKHKQATQGTFLT